MDPLRYELDEEGRTVVGVHQVVRDRAGRVLSDRLVEHVYVVEDGRVRSMEIRERAADPPAGFGPR